MDDCKSVSNEFDWRDDKWAEDPTYYCPCCFKGDADSLGEALEAIAIELEHARVMLDRLQTFNEVIWNATQADEEEPESTCVSSWSEDSAEEQAGSAPDEGRFPPVDIVDQVGAFLGDRASKERLNR